jgi:hypothetical protein
VRVVIDQVGNTLHFHILLCLSLHTEVVGPLFGLEALALDSTAFLKGVYVLVVLVI